MEEQVQPVETKKRPVFITVLGILSFIGIAWQIIQGFITMGAGAVTSAVTGTGSNLSQEMQNVEGMDSAMAGLNQAVDAANKLAQNATALGIVNIICALICLLGVLWMWKLLKKGFYVYLVGELAAPIITLILVGFGIGGFFATMGFIVPIIMVILYAVNLKHMS